MRFFLFLLFAMSAAAQSVGDFSISYKATPTGPQPIKSWAKANSTLWGTDGSGNPQSITIGSGLSLASGVLTASGGGVGTGTVTSVGLTMPNIFSVTGSPITSSGTLAAALAAQAAKKVFAGPATGADATPTFRDLVAGDIPDLSSIYQLLITDGSLTIARTNGLQTALNAKLSIATAEADYLTIAAAALAYQPTSANLNELSTFGSSAGGHFAGDVAKVAKYGNTGELGVSGSLLIYGDVAFNVTTLTAQAGANPTVTLPSTGGTLALTSDNITGTAAGLSTTLAIASGGTGATTAAAARTALGLGTLATQSGTFSGTSSGTNTGDQTITLTGDVTGSGSGSFAATLANTAVTPGTYGSATKSLTATVDSKGRLTALSEQTVTPAESSVTFTDITTNNASTTKHGYLPKLDGNSVHYLDGTGAFSAPPIVLAIGSTAINGGTDGYILYYNDGILGNLATTGSGSVVRATSPTMSDAMITGKAYFGNSNNYARRNGTSGNTEIVTATSAITLSAFSGAVIMEATTTGVTLPGLVVDTGLAYSYPGSYPSLPNYDNFARGRSYRPGTNVTAFAHQIIAPGDIYDGAGITITDAATLYIHGEPFAHPAGGAIAGNKWALWIGHGAARFDGPVALGSGGTKHTKIKSGVATLVAGTVTVSDSDVLETGTASTSSRILVTRMTDGGTLGTSYSITRTNATSFTITSSSASETSTLSWVIFNP